MKALLLLVALQQPNEPLKDWKVQRRETNPKTGQVEIVAFIEGDEAVLLNTTRDKELVDIKGLRLRYFTEPRKQGEKSEEVKLRSDKARVDNEKERVDLSGRVRIEKGDGTVVEAPEATLFFHKKFVCPTHDVREARPGKCPACGADLKPHTFSSIEAPRTFEMTKPDPATHLAGEGLTASDDVRSLRVERDGSLMTAGPPKELVSPAPATAPSRSELTEMRSRGPMTFVENESGITVTGEKEVRIRRTQVTPDGPVITTVEADAAELLARRPPGPDRRPVPEKLTARGRIRMAGPEGTATADTLAWDHADLGDFATDVADLTGSVRVEKGRNTIECRAVKIERLSGISTFTDDVRASLVPGTGADAQPVALRSRTLITRQLPGAKELSEIEALGDVMLEGFNPAPGQKPGRAEADRFFWDQAGNHGLLEKRPFVRIVQEASTLFAPRVVLEGNSKIVLKGPKFVVLSQMDEKGKEARTTVTADSDIVLDSSGERKTLRLQDACVVRTPEVHLFSDRMVVTMSKENRVETLQAWGRVRARQIQEGATLFGEWMTLEPKTETKGQKMTLTGSPLAIADMGRTIATQEKILVYERPDPVTGQPVQFQEMRGGKRGVRIVVDERPR